MEQKLEAKFSGQVNMAITESLRAKPLTEQERSKLSFVLCANPKEASSYCLVQTSELETAQAQHQRSLVLLRDAQGRVLGFPIVQGG